MVLLLIAATSFTLIYCAYLVLFAIPRVRQDRQADVIDDIANELSRAIYIDESLPASPAARGMLSWARFVAEHSRSATLWTMVPMLRAHRSSSAEAPPPASFVVSECDDQTDEERLALEEVDVSLGIAAANALLAGSPLGYLPRRLGLLAMAQLLGVEQASGSQIARMLGVAAGGPVRRANLGAATHL